MDRRKKSSTTKTGKSRLHNWKTIQYGDIKVYYLPELDGGALDFGEEAYRNTVKKLYGKVDKLCEFCAGPGFIGFSLLANGMCRKLCLVDVNPQAIECCRKTIAENGLRKVVTTYVSDVLKRVPKKEVWDLVVSNPPHFDGTKEMYKKDIIAIDPAWMIHEKFYKTVSPHLTQRGSLLFLENLLGAPENMWKEMINKNGLKFVSTFWEKLPPAKLIQRTLTFISLLSWVSTRRFIKACIKQRNTNFLLQRVYPYYFVWAKKI